MRKLRLLDLCCGAGGCSVGYNRAADELGLDLEITGVDIKDQPNYPFYFEKDNALDFLDREWKYFSHIHASPPCQIYSKACGEARNKGHRFPDLLKPIQKLMYASGLPGVIENVRESPLRPDLLLNGTMFGLKLIRQRKFELVNWFMMRPGSGAIRKGAVIRGELMCVAGKGALISKSGAAIQIEGSTILEKASRAMGIDWMSYNEIREAIPPAYTKYIGLEFLKNNVT